MYRLLKCAVQSLMAMLATRPWPSNTCKGAPPISKTPGPFRKKVPCTRHGSSEGAHSAMLVWSGAADMPLLMELGCGHTTKSCGMLPSTLEASML